MWTESQRPARTRPRIRGHDLSALPVAWQQDCPASVMWLGLYHYSYRCNLFIAIFYNGKFQKSKICVIQAHNINNRAVCINIYLISLLVTQEISHICRSGYICYHKISQIFTMNSNMTVVLHLVDDGQVLTCGSNAFGQLGVSPQTQYAAQPLITVRMCVFLYTWGLHALENVRFKYVWCLYVQKSKLS